MKELKLENSNDVALVDDCDYERLSQYKWYKTGDINFGIFRNTLVNQGEKEMLANAVIQSQGMYDHINQNPLDNQKLNLRVTTYSLNNHNKCKLIFPGSVRISEYKGVSRKRHKWRARIVKDGIDYYLGVFKSQVEAAKAYDLKAKELYGEYACLNFPNA